MFSNYDETKSKEQKNKERKKKAHRGQSVRYRSWWKQGNIKMAVSEDHASCWVYKDLTGTTIHNQPVTHDFASTDGHWWRETTGLTGDQVESKGASSGRPDLPMSVSPAACRARPSAIATKNAQFVFLAIFWQVRKVAGLIGDWTESKRASSGRPDLPVTVLLMSAARDRVP